MTATKKTEKAPAKKAPAKKRTAKKAPVKKPTAKKDPAKGSADKPASTIRPGNYIYALGRRKSASAQARLYPAGKGEITVNGQKLEEYFVTLDQHQSIKRPLELAGKASEVDVDFRVKGGGLIGQADACRLGVSRALIKLDAELRKTLKKQGLLTRDARVKERKKPGLKKARRAPQWSKR